MSWVYEALKRSQIDVTRVSTLVEEPPAAQPASPGPLPDNLQVQKLDSFAPVCVGTDVPALPLKVRPAQRLVAMTDEHGLPAEKFRMLANRLANLRGETGLKLLHITSSVAGEGKSLVASNLAVTLARRHQERVLLLEGDLRRMSIAKLFGVDESIGLGEWWEQKDSQLPQLYRINESRLWLLLAGRVERPSDVLQSGRLPKLIRRLAGMFDWVILDSPPLIPLADANVWARWADGTLLVVREGVAPRKALQKGLENLDNPKIVGVVLNDAEEGDRVYYYDHYYKLNPNKPATAKGPA